MAETRESPAATVEVSPYHRLVRDAAVYGTGRIAGYLAAIILMPVYTHCLTLAEYGALENLMVFVSLLGTGVSLGLPGALERFWFLDTTEEGRRRTVGSAAGGVLLALAVALVPVLLLARPAARILAGSADHAAAVRLAAALLVPSSLLALVLSLLRVRFHAASFAAVSVAQVVLLAALNTWFVAGAGLGLSGVFLGGGLAAAGAAILGLLLLRGPRIRRPDGRRLSEMLAYGLPLVPAAFAFWALSSADRYVLTGLRGLETTGLYSASLKIAGIVSFLGFAANTAFVPVALQISGEPGARTVYARCLTGFLAVSAWAALGLSALSREALAVLAPPEYADGSRAVPLLAFGFALSGAAPFLTVGIHVLRRTVHITWVAVVSAAANLLLMFALVPPLGLLGAAAACFAGNVLMAWLYLRIGQRIYPLPLEGRRLLRLAGLATASAAAVILLDYPGLGFTGARLGVALLFPVLLLAAGVLRPGEVRGLLAAFRLRRTTPAAPGPEGGAA